MFGIFFREIINSCKPKVFGISRLKQKARVENRGWNFEFPLERSQWSVKIPYIFEQITITTVVEKKAEEGDKNRVLQKC